MRLSLFVLLLGTAPMSAVAQTGPQPTLVLTVFAGVATGHSLWNVPRQPIEQRDSAPTGFAPFNPPVYDTLALSRQVGSSIMGGMSATLFPSPHLGLELEVSYLSLPLENGCTGIYFDSTSAQTDQERKNQQLCGNIDASKVSASALGLFGGITLRAAPRGSVSPYVRAGVGITSISRSTIALEGEFISSGGIYSKGIIVDPKPRETAASFLLGLGITSSLGPAYRFRLEIRDILASQSRVASPANGLGLVASSSKMYHHVALTMGLDVVLERKRGRRY